MGLSYLGGKSWTEITREERFFCQEFYRELTEDGLRTFIDFLYSKGLSIDPYATFEVGFEVCFYRDLKFKGLFHGKKSEYSPKRTFDLCLFSENEMVIIEAKVSEGLTNKQMDDFEKDLKWVPNALGNEDFKVHLVALISSEYSPTPITQNRFDKIFTWRQISDLFPQNKIFERTDRIFCEKQISANT